MLKMLIWTSSVAHHAQYLPPKVTQTSHKEISLVSYEIQSMTSS